MALILFLAASLAGNPAATGPVAPPPAPATTPVKQASEGCAFSRESAEKGEVVVCAQRPQTYRIDPDVMAAKKAVRGNGGKPKPPERFRETSCKTVGPQNCNDGGVNLLAAALTAAKMADKLSKGESVGSMFITDPHPTEYQAYQEAKRQRQAKEEEAKAKEAVKAAAAAKAGATP